MKRINQYKKLFKIEQKIELSALKKTYRNLVKEWHPDKFQQGDDKAVEAEIKSREIIDGYHFLISIAPETKEKYSEEYIQVSMKSGINDFQHKGLLLEVTFNDGTSYEYFGVTKTVFQKLINSDKQMRFSKRNIFNSYLYRKSKSGLEEQTYNEHTTNLYNAIVYLLNTKHHTGSLYFTNKNITGFESNAMSLLDLKRVRK